MHAWHPSISHLKRRHRSPLIVCCQWKGGRFTKRAVCCPVSGNSSRMVLWTPRRWIWTKQIVVYAEESVDLPQVLFSWDVQRTQFCKVFVVYKYLEIILYSTESGKKSSVGLGMYLQLPFFISFPYSSILGLAVGNIPRSVYLCIVSVYRIVRVCSAPIVSKNNICLMLSWDIRALRHVSLVWSKLPLHKNMSKESLTCRSHRKTSMCRWFHSLI